MAWCQTNKLDTVEWHSRWPHALGNWCIYLHHLWFIQSLTCLCIMPPEGKWFQGFQWDAAHRFQYISASSSWISEWVQSTRGFVIHVTENDGKLFIWYTAINVYTYFTACMSACVCFLVYPECDTIVEWDSSNQNWRTEMLQRITYLEIMWIEY